MAELEFAGLKFKGGRIGFEQGTAPSGIFTSIVVFR